MTTPIADFVKRYAEQDAVRLHMPGHKGKGLVGCESIDITEIEGADLLYNESGIIKESEENAAWLFDSGRTLYSAEGSSLAIRAMVCLTVMYAKAKGRKPLIAAGRNSHKTFLTACALLNAEVDWLLPENAENIISCKITAGYLEAYLSKTAEKPVAVYVTSPDYLGTVLDIGALSAVCSKYNVLLLVDNAHGAYLRFLPESRHPISLGADMCCDSAHKTLPALTGTAYLHISKSAPEFFKDEAPYAMAHFASTSPSYMILQSLDLVNKYIAEGYPQRLSAFVNKLSELKARLFAGGFTLFSDEPLKITVAPKSYGYTGTQLSEHLADRGLICEFSDPDFTVMMLTPENTDSDIIRLEKALISLERKIPVADIPPVPRLNKKIMSLSEALFSPSVSIGVDNAVGKIMAEASVICPPAIPIAICGEQITSDTVKAFKYYGIKKVRVIK